MSRGIGFAAINVRTGPESDRYHAWLQRYIAQNPGAVDTRQEERPDCGQGLHLRRATGVRARPQFWSLPMSSSYNLI
jgi:hypothetical protein